MMCGTRSLVLCCIVIAVVFSTPVVEGRKRTASTSKRPCSCADCVRGGSSNADALRQLSSTSGGGKACGLYIWDGPSALLSKWCNHLLKDCIYEGKGGHKFARIAPGSVLQLLYPCNRYSTDRCVLCGGNWRDHLTLWWGKNLYTPYDRWLDDSLANGVQTTSEEPRKFKPSKHNKVPPPEPRQMKQHVFHRRYVLDIEAASAGATSTRLKKKRIDNAIHSDASLRRGTERRTTETSVTYLLPRVHKKDGSPVFDGSPMFHFVYRFVRHTMLRQLDGLIDMEKDYDERPAD